MHFCLAFAALSVALQNFGPVAAVSLQTFAPCEDLSPHCASLCATCDSIGQWPHDDHSYEIEAPSVPVGGSGRPANNTGKDKPVGIARTKRLANEHPPQQSRGWISMPSGDKPDWLPSWFPWLYKPRPGTHGRPGGPATSGPSGPHGGHSSGGDSGEHGFPPGPPPGGHTGGPELPSKECGDLVNGGRQLIEAFCPKSCGRCGRSSTPLAAAKVYINAQCSVAKEPAVGFALS